MVKITKQNDEYFMLIDDQEPVKLEVKQPKGWDPTIFLPENPTKRTLVNKGVADKKLEAGNGEFELTVKADRAAPGSNGPTIPNKKMVEYLKGYTGTAEEPVDGDALYAEYMEIIERAIKAKDEQKAKPMTELEKAKAKLEKAREALAKLEADAAKSAETGAVAEATDGAAVNDFDATHDNIVKGKKGGKN